MGGGGDWISGTPSSLCRKNCKSELCLMAKSLCCEIPKDRLHVFKNPYAKFFHVIWSISQKNAQRCLLLQTVMPGFLTFSQLMNEPTDPSCNFVTIILIAKNFVKTGFQWPIFNSIPCFKAFSHCLFVKAELHSYFIVWATFKFILRGIQRFLSSYLLCRFPCNIFLLYFRMLLTGPTIKQWGGMLYAWLNSSHEIQN